MASEGLHEAAELLSGPTIDRHRAITSVMEELAAIDWYDQRVEATDDGTLAAVLVDGAELSEEDLCRWAVDHVPYFAVPRYIEFRDDLPRNPVGRVLKYQLRAEGVTDRTWDREAAGVRFERR